MKKANTTHFGIQRKIVANMTSESWETIPHVTYMYEPPPSKEGGRNKMISESITSNFRLLRTWLLGLFNQ